MFNSHGISTVGHWWDVASASDREVETVATHRNREFGTKVS
jgi:hypothetical protein